jgi:hypothetical protein
LPGPKREAERVFKEPAEKNGRVVVTAQGGLPSPLRIEYLGNGMAHLFVDKRISWTKALKLVELLQVSEDDVQAHAPSRPEYHEDRPVEHEGAAGRDSR